MSKASNVVPLRGKNGPAPNIENGKVPPPRRKNSDSRPREYLTADEVDRLIVCSQGTRETRPQGRYTDPSGFPARPEGV